LFSRPDASRAPHGFDLEAQPLLIAGCWPRRKEIKFFALSPWPLGTSAAVRHGVDHGRFANGDLVTDHRRQTLTLGLAQREILAACERLDHLS
jgi:hypothetical protein